MKRANPFPGMNPWMQKRWGDVHVSLIGYIRDALGKSLPDDLVASSEENISLESFEGKDNVVRPDLAVTGPESWKQGRSPQWKPEEKAQADQALPRPVLVEIDEIPERWIEVHTAGGKLVTVIEVTSPSNKTREGRRDFESKIKNLVLGGVNTMEIDLLSGGVSAKDVRGGFWPDSEFQVVVNRAYTWSPAEVYPCPLREPLPPVRVPLRDGETDVILELQPMIDRCYELGRYWSLDYESAPPFHLSEENAEWVRQKIGAAGLVASDQ